MIVNPNTTPPKTWAERLKHASYWRREVKRSFGDNISHIQVLDGFQLGDRRLGPLILGLGSMPTRDSTPPVQTLVYAELNDSQGDQLELKPLLNIEDFAQTDETKRPSAELTLFFERTRSQIWNGIISYSIHLPSQRLLLSTSSGISVYADGKIQPIAEWCQGETLNALFCPSNPDYVAFCSKGQLYIDRLNNSVFTTASADSHPAITNGVASFVVQEELERDQGFWWNPRSLALVYERVDSRQLVELSFAAPGKQLQDPMRYPLCGTENAKSHLHLVVYDENSGKFVDRPLLTFIEKFVPDYEYIASAGWLEDGESFYVIVMNRVQTKKTVLLIGKEAFTFSSSEPKDLPIQIIYEEESNIWINNNQLTSFLPNAPNKFIYGSEKANTCHLYIKKLIDESGNFTEESITAGEWSIIKEVKPTIDLKRSHIYYLANLESPLSTSLCVSSYEPSSGNKQHQLLTPIDLCYKLDRSESELSLNPDLGFVCWLSSIKHLPECHFYSLIHHSSQSLPTSQLQYKIRLQPSITPPIQLKPNDNKTDVPMSPALNQLLDQIEQPLVPESLFSHSFCEVPLEDGQTSVRCLVLLPTHNPSNTEKFPVIHYVYAGPCSQVVRNSWIGIAQFLKYLTAGYAVFLSDCRGSSNRGINFESPIKYNLGSVEVEDQVHALTYAANHFFPLLDLDRVGVTGWSYGGYISLQIIARYPHIYKCSIPGGSVVDWELYDTAYTERFMGLPADNVEGYKNSSVLSRIASLPDEEDRLLIVHGLIDENVHFHHTEKLINALVNAGKPHKLLIFPTERHGIRKAENVEFLHASMISFFDQNLKQQQNE